jgi:integrase
MMVTLLSWALDRAMIRVNVAAGIRKLHHIDRADLIWEPHHWQAMADAPPHLMRALRMSEATGLRLSDLVALDWSHVGDHSICVTTAKRRTRAVIPLYPALRALLGPRGSGSVLTRLRGGPWTAGGLKTAFQRAKPEGFDRRIHDLRGTFVTRLCMADFTDEQIARIIGWGVKRVAEIRARYVDETRVVIALAERMGA